MARAVEWFVAATTLILGVSHIVRAGTWIEGYRQMHRLGRPGAFVNGALNVLDETYGVEQVVSIARLFGK